MTHRSRLLPSTRQGDLVPLMLPPCTAVRPLCFQIFLRSQNQHRSDQFSIWVDLLGDILSRSSNECPRQTREARERLESWYGPFEVPVNTGTKSGEYLHAFWTERHWPSIWYFGMIPKYQIEGRKRDHRDVPCWQEKLKVGEGWGMGSKYAAHFMYRKRIQIDFPQVANPL